MNKKIVPAIIAKNQIELNEKLLIVKKYVDLVQLDVMDNNFVPNTSLFFDFSLLIKQGAPLSSIVYLFVYEVTKW